MRKRAFLAIAVLVCAVFVMGMATAEAFDIILDNFCDGFNLNFDGARVYGTQTGCGSGEIIGDLAFVPKEGLVLTISTCWEELELSCEESIYTYYIRFNKTWSNYYTVPGGPPVKVFDGTWSSGAPSVANAGLPSGAPK